MSVNEPTESSVLNRLEKQILHGLVTDARIPFARLGAILGVSEQTVAGRYRSLRQRDIIHVSGLVNGVPLGQTRWILRLRTTPERALRLGESLARFPDVSWISLLSTCSEVVCVSRPETDERRDALLLNTLPKAAQLTGMVAHEVMHRFPLTEEWPRYSHLFTSKQLRELGTRHPMPDKEPGRSVELSKEDRAMLAVLALDARASYAQLAAATGWSPTKVARRMTELVEAGVLYFDIDFAMERMGESVRANLWLRVRPLELDAVGEAIAQFPETAYVAATTGPTNVMISIVCRDTAHLYRYVTERLGPLEGINDVEVTPVLRTFKQAQALTYADRVTLVPEPSRA